MVNSKHSHLMESLKKESGTMPNKELSKKYNIPLNTINVIQHKHGLPSYKKNNMKLTKKVIKEIKPLLGMIPDTVIAKKYNVHWTTINKLRLTFNIKSSQIKCITESLLNDLGKDYDFIIAGKHNVERETIAYYRRKLKIISYKDRLKLINCKEVYILWLTKFNCNYSITAHRTDKSLTFIKSEVTKLLNLVEDNRNNLIDEFFSHSIDFKKFIATLTIPELDNDDDYLDFILNLVLKDKMWCPKLLDFMFSDNFKINLL